MNAHRTQAMRENMSYARGAAGTLDARPHVQLVRSFVRDDERWPAAAPMVMLMQVAVDPEDCARDACREVARIPPMAWMSNKRPRRDGMVGCTICPVWVDAPVVNVAVVRRPSSSAHTRSAGAPCPGSHHAFRPHMGSHCDANPPQPSDNIAPVA